MERLFENHRQERIVKILKMIKEGKIVNRNTIGDLGVGETALSRDFESIMYDLKLPIMYDGKLHSYVATDDFEIPWRVVNDEIDEVLQSIKQDIQKLTEENPNCAELNTIKAKLETIEKLNSEILCLIEKPGFEF